MVNALTREGTISAFSYRGTIMKPIAWIEDLKLGIPQIDEDHQNLFKYMIRLEEINHRIEAGQVDCDSEILTG